MITREREEEEEEEANRQAKKVKRNENVKTLKAAEQKLQ